jgi:hypothetical protein
MKMIQMAMSIATASFFLGCYGDEKPHTPNSIRAAVTHAEARKAITTAESQYAEVKAMRGIIWRHTAKTLQHAKDALKKGDFKMAYQKAMVVRFEATSAMEQSAQNDAIWQDAMPQALIR